MPLGVFKLMRESPTPEHALSRLAESVTENELLLPHPSPEEIEELKKGPRYTGVVFVTPEGKKMRFSLTRKELDPRQIRNPRHARKDPQLFLFNRPMTRIPERSWQTALDHFDSHEAKMPANHDGSSSTIHSLRIPAKAMSHWPVRSAKLLRADGTFENEAIVQLSGEKEFRAIRRLADAEQAIDDYLNVIQVLRGRETVAQFKGALKVRTPSKDSHEAVKQFFAQRKRNAKLYDALAGRALTLQPKEEGIRVTKKAVNEVSRSIAEHCRLPESKFTRNLAGKFLDYFDGRLIRKMEEAELLRDPVHH